MDDLAAYKRLIDLWADLDAMANKCWSPAAATAIRSAAKLVRLVASGLYRASLSDPQE